MTRDLPNNGDPPERLTADHWRAILAHQSLLFDVISDSMYPTFRKGEKVHIRALEPGEPLRGQIAAYWRGMLFTHRLMGDGICQGDNSLKLDDPIRAEDMVGIVTAVHRGGRLVPLGRRRPWRTKIRRLRLWLRGLRAAVRV